MAPEAANAEFDRTQNAISFLLHPQRFFRPYGQGGNLDQRLLSRPVLDHLEQARATIVLWSALPRDWQDPDGWVERALDQCAAIPWSLMVLHDLPTGAMGHSTASSGSWPTAAAASGRSFRRIVCRWWMAE